METLDANKTKENFLRSPRKTKPLKQDTRLVDDVLVLLPGEHMKKNHYGSHSEMPRWINLPILALEQIHVPRHGVAIQLHLKKLLHRGEPYVEIDVVCFTP